MSDGSDSSGGCGGCGCLLWIFILWILFTGLTIDGTRYEFGCNCSDGPSMTSEPNQHGVRVRDAGAND